MRVAADKQFGRFGEQTSADGRVVIARISADVLDQHLRPVHGEAVDLRIEPANLLSVNVSVHGTQGAESGQSLRHFRRTDIARMPYLVAVPEVFQVFVVPKRMSIRQ